MYKTAAWWVFRRGMGVKKQSRGRILPLLLEHRSHLKKYLAFNKLIVYVKAKQKSDGT